MGPPVVLVVGGVVREPVPDVVVVAVGGAVGGVLLVVTLGCTGTSVGVFTGALPVGVLGRLASGVAEPAGLPLVVAPAGLVVGWLLGDVLVLVATAGASSGVEPPPPPQAVKVTAANMQAAPKQTRHGLSRAKPVLKMLLDRNKIIFSNQMCV